MTEASKRKLVSEEPSVHVLNMRLCRQVLNLVHNDLVDCLLDMPSFEVDLPTLFSRARSKLMQELRRDFNVIQLRGSQLFGLLIGRLTTETCHRCLNSARLNGIVPIVYKNF
jgi:hypothetical protein